MARGDLKCRLDNAALDIARLICASQLMFVRLRCASSSSGIRLGARNDQRSRANEALDDLNRTMYHSERSEAATQPRKLSGRGQAFNLLSVVRGTRSEPEMSESLASCFALRCSASLNMTERVGKTKIERKFSSRTLTVRAAVLYSSPPDTIRD
jgi:hypothetical protein